MSFCRNVNDNYYFGTEIVLHKKSRSVDKMTSFISNWMSRVILKNRWCGVVSNVHLPFKDKGSGTENRFYREVEC